MVCACRGARSDQPLAGPMAKTILCWPESRRAPNHAASSSDEKASPRLSSSASHAGVRARCRATEANSDSSSRKATDSIPAYGAMRSRYRVVGGPRRSLRVRCAMYARVRFRLGMAFLSPDSENGSVRTGILEFRSAFALYQGTTSVVPHQAKSDQGFSPCYGKTRPPTVCVLAQKSAGPKGPHSLVRPLWHD
jgi:hypothetical protein